MVLNYFEKKTKKTKKTKKNIFFKNHKNFFKYQHLTI